MNEAEASVFYSVPFREEIEEGGTSLVSNVSTFNSLCIFFSRKKEVRKKKLKSKKIIGGNFSLALAHFSARFMRDTPRYF